ncbi:hypothetical protein BKA70DRAFT_1116065 [Coprinopsis sp. MPI-PUGE-AT-0042]|nr:hypothetical protein BKA70DRAFT_1116065 [Coprinopsis sp. MPI-PUGE-AT-0042]
MYWKLLLSLSALSLSPVDALLRLPCSQLVTERFDPLVTPGRVSPHVHQVVGGVGVIQAYLRHGC